MTPLLEALLVSSGLAAVSVAARLVRPGAAPGGVLVGTLVYLGGGRGGFVLLVAFFAIGVSLTKLGYSRKAARGLAEPDQGRRGSAHALANGGVAMLLAVSALVWPGFERLASVGIAGALAAALADTTGSEIGQLYGQRPISPLTFRAVAPGTEGAVSVEGTLAGVAAAAAIAVLGLVLGLYGSSGVLAVATGGAAGSILESIVASGGATRRVGHMALNVGNTAVGASLAMLLATWLRT